VFGLLVPPALDSNLLVLLGLDSGLLAHLGVDSDLLVPPGLDYGLLAPPGLDSGPVACWARFLEGPGLILFGDHFISCAEDIDPILSWITCWHQLGPHKAT
jgi:hypothetical protein